MHRKVIRYFQGYVRLLVTGFSPERFFNLCQYRGIDLWDLTAGQTGCRCCIKIADFRTIRDPVLKSGVRVRILEKHGFPFFLFRSRKRKGWAAGFLTGCLLLYLCSLFLWNITITGNTQVSSTSIRKTLREAGYQEGIRIDRILCEDVEKLLRFTYPNITWASAEISGTCLNIQVKENEVPEEKTETELTACDVRSPCAGTILSIITRSGTPLVKAGDAVSEGEVLIRGAVELKNDAGESVAVHPVAADGDIIAEYTFSYQDSFPVLQEKTAESGRQLLCFAFFLFGHEWTAGSIPEGYSCVTEETRLCLFGDYLLPVGMRKQSCREQVRYEWFCGREAAGRMAEERLEAYLEELRAAGTEGEALSLELEKRGGNWYAAACIRAVGPIGEKTPLYE